MPPTFIDVDTFKVPTPKTPTPKSSNEPIVISDDEIEEVAANLAPSSRNTRTRSVSKASDVQSVRMGSTSPERIDLSNLSDDEDAPTTSTAKATVSYTLQLEPKIEPRASSAPGHKINWGPAKGLRDASRTAAVGVPGPSSRKKEIFGGPPSAIIQHTRKATPPDSEDEYEDTSLLKPYRHPTPRADEPEQLDISVMPTESLPSRKRKFIDISCGNIPPAPAPPKAYPKVLPLWVHLDRSNVLPISRPRPRFLSTKRQRLNEALNLDHFVRAHHFRRSGGAINRIIQHHGRVVICSNTAGGNGNAAEETDPYNKAGTLISWSKREPFKIIDLEQGGAEHLFDPHFSVHCVAYNPTSNILASSGADKRVRTWNFDINNAMNPYTPFETYKYKVQAQTHSPHDLAFKPETAILAVGEQRLTIHDFAQDGDVVCHFDLVAKRRERDAHVTGAIAWGTSSTSSLIFALSEPVSKENNVGHHSAFDVYAEGRAFTFDAEEAGDALCLDSTGGTAALVTNNGAKSLVRIYDVARRDGGAMRERRLEPFTSEAHEVNAMAFSPDGIYLALGRDDNRTHVYDSRMLERGVLFDFRHSELEHRAKDTGDFFGVVGVKWAESSSARSRLGLVTGGNDGCIRLWDPLRAQDEGSILAQADSDIAAFTLGDPFQGEHELVVGDSDGAVYIMDGHASM